MNKPELLITAGSMDEVETYIQAGIDAIIIGEEQYGLRLPGNFSIFEMEQAVKTAHEHGVKIYAAVNNIFENKEIPDLVQYVEQLSRIHVDAVIFGDPAVLMAMKQVGVNLPLHWNGEMTSTNYATANYWASKGAIRIISARELNLDELVELKQNTSMEVQVQVHGMTNIYHSKRNLVKHYITHQGKSIEGVQVGTEKGLYLVEAERQELKFPIFEDRNGTHIMSADDICLLEDLHELMEANMDSFYIESVLHTTVYNTAVVQAYRKCIDTFAQNPGDYEFDEDWLGPVEQVQPDDRELSFGFLYKEQVY